MILSVPASANDVPFAELSTHTRDDEARVAMAVVDLLRRRDVGRREILIVARDLDPYEDALTRAALRRGITLTFWSQLDVGETDLYRVLIDTSEMLGPGLISAGEISTVLASGWTPPRPDDSWPLSETEVTKALETFNPTTRANFRGWKDRLQKQEVDDRVLRFLDWLHRQNPPTSNSIESVLGGLIERYRDIVLPRIQRHDDPALSYTEQAVQSVVTLSDLVSQASAKFGSRVAADQIDQSWENVTALIETLANQRPGRREHSNARAIDAIEANDILVQQASYIITLGLVDGEWPDPSKSSLPTQLRARIIEGTDGAAPILPRPSWSGGRDTDQFVELLQAATEGVVLIRHTRTVEGEEVSPSPLLRNVETITINESTCRELVTERESTPSDILDALEFDRKGQPEETV